MSKNTLSILVLSVLAVFIWIGYSVYENLTNNQNYDAEAGSYDISAYTQPVSTDMQTKTLTKINSLSGNIKVTDSSLSN